MGKEGRARMAALKRDAAAEATRAGLVAAMAVSGPDTPATKAEVALGTQAAVRLIDKIISMHDTLEQTPLRHAQWDLVVHARQYLRELRGLLEASGAASASAAPEARH